MCLWTQRDDPALAPRAFAIELRQIGVWWSEHLMRAVEPDPVANSALAYWGYRQISDQPAFALEDLEQRGRAAWGGQWGQAPHPETQITAAGS